MKRTMEELGDGWNYSPEALCVFCGQEVKICQSDCEAADHLSDCYGWEWWHQAPGYTCDYCHYVVNKDD